jgi:hypothetical protein
MQRQPPRIERPDLREKGAPRDGEPQTSDQRLFMQLLAFGGVVSAGPLVAALQTASFEAVLYDDLHDPHGVALLTMHQDPGFFVTELRSFLNREPFGPLALKPQYTMFGRTYSLGYEPDLNEVLFDRPRRTAMNRAWPWAIWYPLRRAKRFSKLQPQEQREILMEHGQIGRAFGEADYAHDIRLACYGLDCHDNDFVVGLMGPNLHPLSAIVQTMRSTRQTSEFLENLGPFFVGKAIWPH